MDNIGFEERRAGFTLVELLTVIAVIAIIAGIIFGVAAIAAKKAAITAAQADLERLVYLLQDYKLRDGRYYSSSVTRPKFVKIKSVNDPTMNPSSLRSRIRESGKQGHEIKVLADSELVDPWGNQYEYLYINKHNIELRSLGPDGRQDSSQANYKPVDDIKTHSQRN